MAKVVIVGSGISGTAAAASLTEKGHSITLINGEGFLPYYRMRLEEVVTGEAPESLFMHDEAWYSSKEIRLISGYADKIDRTSHLLFLKDQEALHYDKLILAMGSKPVIAPLDGNETIYALRSMEDALLLRKALEGGAKSVVIIGGGLLGIELAAGLKKKYGVKINVLEAGPYILPRQLDAEMADHLQSRLHRLGIHIVTGAKARFAGGGEVLADDGRRLEADVVISSIGVKPEITLLREAGLDIGRGVIINEYLETSDRDIYAVGDVAELNGICVSLASEARAMALHVASEIERDERIAYLPPVPSTTLKVAGIDVALFGERMGREHLFHKGDGLIKVYTKGDAVVGVVLIDAKSYMGRARSVIGRPFERKLFDD